MLVGRMQGRTRGGAIASGHTVRDLCNESPAGSATLQTLAAESMWHGEYEALGHLLGGESGSLQDFCIEPPGAVTSLDLVRTLERTLRAMPDRCGIERLRIARLTVTAALGVPLFEMLARMPLLQRLSFENTVFEEGAWSRPSLLRLETLNVVGTTNPAPLLDVLADKTPNLRTLHFAPHDGVADANANKRLNEAFRQWERLEDLTLENPDLCAVDYLRSRSLKRLCLENKRLHPEELKYLIAVLRGNPQLSSLELRHCATAGAGADDMLLGYLVRTPTLGALTFADSTFDPQLAALTARHPGLKFLNLEGNRMCPGSVTALCAGLRSNTQLVSLRLPPLSEEQTKLLAATVERHASIRLLSIRGVRVNIRSEA